MSRAKHDLARAEAQAAQARRQLANTLGDIQARLSPRVLARDAVEEIRDTTVEIAHAALDAVKRNPAPWLGIGAAISFVIGQRWFGRTAPEAEAISESPTLDPIATRNPQ